MVFPELWFLLVMSGTGSRWRKTGSEDASAGSYALVCWIRPFLVFDAMRRDEIRRDAMADGCGDGW